MALLKAVDATAVKRRPPAVHIRLQLHTRRSPTPPTPFTSPAHKRAGRTGDVRRVEESWLFRKSTWVTAGVALAGFIAGVMFWGGFNTAMEAANTEIVFCISCHEMRDNVYQEMQGHDPLDQPLRRTRDLPGLPCPEGLDAEGHPQDPGVQRGMGEAVRHDRYAGEIPGAAGCDGRGRMGDDEGEGNPRMPQLPHLRGDGFQHQQNADDAPRMNQGLDQRADLHRLPQGHRPPSARHDGPASRRSSPISRRRRRRWAPSKGQTLYTMTTKPFWLDKPKDETDTSDGKLVAATPVEVVDQDGVWLKVKFSGWQQEGAERALYAATRPAHPGGRVRQRGGGQGGADRHPKTDPDTQLVWHRATVVLWITAQNATKTSARPLGAGGLWRRSCSATPAAPCHSPPPPDGQCLANQWAGTLNSMKPNVALDDEQYRFLQKYLQMHAQDMGGKHE